MKKIAIIVDNPLRDLPACVLTAGALAEKGHQVYLVSFDNAAQATFSIAPDYLLVNYARITNETFLLRLHEAGIPVGVLDTEGGVFVRLEEEGGVPNFVKTYPKNPVASASIKDYFIWGKEIFDFLNSSNYFPKESLHLTGTPRSDVMHPSLRGQSYKGEKIILVNTSFTLGNPKFRSAEAEAEDLINKFGFPRELVYPVMEAQKGLLKSFIQMTKDLAQKFPKEKFVLRPHPFENHEQYRKGLEGLSNVEVRGDSTIDAWLEKSKALFHFECSTAIEAALMNVPAFSLKESASLRPIESISKVTHYCENFQDLTQKIETVLNGTYQRPASLEAKHHEVIQNVYFQYDGKSHLRVVEKIQKSLNDKAKRNQAALLKWKSFYTGKNLLKKLMGRPIVREQKFFSLDQTQALLQNFKTVKAPQWDQLQCQEKGTGILISKS